MSTVLLVACDPLAPLKVENRTNQILTVYAAYTKYEHVNAGDDRELLGSVEPGKVLEPEYFPGSAETYLFEAKNTDVNLVYSKEFTKKELKTAKWKVVIPPQSP